MLRNTNDLFCQNEFKSLLSYVEQGWIPGPNETRKDFHYRILQTSSNNDDCIYKKDFLGFEQVNCEISYTKKRLCWWESGATWIESCKLPYVRLKSRNKEVLHHEFIHVLRSAFKEEKYEEFIAHRVSKNKWRRFYGPLIHRFSDVCWMFFGTVCGCVLDFCNGSFYFSLLIYLGFILFFIFRLVKRQKTLRKTEIKLANIFKGLQILQVLIFLTDDEIESFSRLGESRIKTYLSLQKRKSVRIEALLVWTKSIMRKQSQVN